MARLPEHILCSLYNTIRFTADPMLRPHVTFFGCPREDGSKQIRRLRLKEEPQNWFDLLWIIRRAGFVELSLSLKGGADAGVNQTSQAPSVSHVSLPQVDDTQAWQSLDDTFYRMRGGSDGSGLPHADLCRHLLISSRLDQFAALDSIHIDPTHCLSPARVASLAMLLQQGPVPPLPLPSWVEPGRCLAVRVNGLCITDLLPPGHHSGGGQHLHPHALSKLFLAKLCRTVPELEACRLNEQDPGDYADMASSLQVCTGDNPACNSVVIRVILPRGDNWRRCLLAGDPRLAPASYITLDTNHSLMEVPLHERDSDLLKALALASGTDDHSFCTMLATAFSQVLGGSFAQIRFSVEVFRSRGRPHLVDHGPRSPQSQIMLGTSALHLLAARRRGRLVRLALGVGSATPVSILIELPEIPSAVLQGLLNAATPAALIPLASASALLSSVTLPPPIVLGPLNRKWLSESLRGLGRDEEREKLRSIAQHFDFRDSNQASLTCGRFLGRPGTLPFAFTISCSSLSTLHDLIRHLLSEEGSQQIEGILGFKPSTIFIANAPLECLDLLGAQGMSAIIRDLRRNATVPGSS